MTKKAKTFIGIFTCILIVSCDTKTIKQTKSLISNNNSTTFKIATKEFKAIKYIDSFINVNNDAIKKNIALKEHYEGLCTKQLLPLIEKKGLYEDLPFRLAVTTMHNDIAYGNFIYDDDKYYVKVTCIINKEQLEKLQENSQYLIKFKTARFGDGVSFENEFSRIEFPTVNAYLMFFTHYLD